MVSLGEALPAVLNPDQAEVMMAQPATLLDAALAYAERRWSVVPVAPRGKQPLIPWAEFQHRRAGAEEIRGWFRQWPDANLAVVTGAISNFIVLDIDPRHGGEAALKLLADDIGPIPSTLEAETGGGGRHLYFAWPGRTVRNRTGLRPGIDLRGARQDAHDRLADHRLAGTGLADQGDGLAGGDPEAHAADRLEPAFRQHEADPQIPDTQQIPQTLCSPWWDFPGYRSSAVVLGEPFIGRLTAVGTRLVAGALRLAAEPPDRCPIR
jgi:hypothetical protein